MRLFIVTKACEKSKNRNEFGSMIGKFLNFKVSQKLAQRSQKKYTLQFNTYSKIGTAFFCRIVFEICLVIISGLK